MMILIMQIDTYDLIIVDTYLLITLQDLYRFLYDLNKEINNNIRTYKESTSLIFSQSQVWIWNTAISPNLKNCIPRFFLGADIVLSLGQTPKPQSTKRQESIGKLGQLWITNGLVWWDIPETWGPYICKFELTDNHIIRYIHVREIKIDMFCLNETDRCSLFCHILNLVSCF